MAKYEEPRAAAPPQMNADRQLLEDKYVPARAELLPIQAETFAEVVKVREELKRKAKAGDLGPEEAQEAKYQIAESFYLKQQAARDEVDREFVKAENEWRKGRDATSELLALTRARNRYEAMDQEEVGDEIMRYVNDPAGWHPDQVEALAAVAARVKAKDLSVLRLAMKRVDYTKPWLHDKPALRNLRMMLDAPFGKMRVISPLTGGFEDADLNMLFE